MPARQSLVWVSEASPRAAAARPLGMINRYPGQTLQQRSYISVAALPVLLLKASLSNNDLEIYRQCFLTTFLPLYHPRMSQPN